MPSYECELIPGCDLCAGKLSSRMFRSKKIVRSGRVRVSQGNFQSSTKRVIRNRCGVIQRLVGNALHFASLRPPA